eukprot:TRINITY_DN6231_c0_g2_i3.p2 TRINITY_DN6231_c0_g2~~TRINITY_DN6231_c0_g2_i3.p2  ORF type:complete len:130 (-),score=41.10 TRINITY_DN6231_c0_g2_i3:453-842(-)
MPNLITVLVEDLYSEEEKDLLCMLMLDKSDPVEKETILEVSLSYTNVITKKEESVTKSVSISRGFAFPPVVQVNMEVDKQRNRIVCANAMKEALSAGESNDYQRAVHELERAENIILNSLTATDPFCQM